MIFQKKHFSQSVGSFAAKVTTDLLQLTGKTLPARIEAVSGQFVTCSIQIKCGFALPQVTVPVATSEYIRQPWQVGDTGVLRAVDARIDYVSGQDTAPGDLTQPGNLSSLVFEPIANKAFTLLDGNTLIMYGPNGVKIGNKTMTCFISITNTGISVTVPSGGDFTVNGISALHHTHGGVQTGAGNTGGPQ